MEQFKTIEEILSSDFAFIPDGYTQKAKSDRVLKSTRIEQAIFDDLYDDTSELADVEERGKRKLKSFDSLVNDVFQLIYGLREKYVDEKDMSEMSKKFNKSIIQDLHKDDNFTAVKSACEGKELLSISATEEFSGKLLENLDNLMDKATGGKGKVEGLEKIEQDKSGRSFVRENIVTIDGKIAEISMGKYVSLGMTMLFYIKGIKENGLELQKLDEQSRAKFEEFKAEDLKKVENELKLMGDGDISEIAVIEDKINYGNLTTEEYEELQELIKAAEAYANEVNALAETDKIPGKIAQLEESIKYNEAKRKELKQLISAASEFASKRAEIILNQLKMEHAAIKLYEVVKGTGEIKDTFKFTYDNKDYRWISTSEKIRAGLEVSKLLATLTGLVYPTYIDNAECITTNPGSLYGQVIFARAMNTELSAYYPLRQKKQGEQSLKEAA